MKLLVRCLLNAKDTQMNRCENGHESVTQTLFVVQVLSCEVSNPLCFVYRKCAALATQIVELVCVLWTGNNGHILYLQVKKSMNIEEICLKKLLFQSQNFLLETNKVHSIPFDSICCSEIIHTQSIHAKTKHTRSIIIFK